MPPITFRQRLWAILRQRCPRCGRGKVFSGPLTMRAVCPECGYRFVREAGFFLGAMFVSYALASPLLAIITAILQLFVFPDWHLYQVLGPALIVLLPFLPAIFRYSRVIYFHFEQWVNPVP